MTVLKCGGEYNEGHVAWLVKQLPGHTIYCLTDSFLDDKRFFDTTGATKIMLRYNAWGARGWWAKMEMFRPELKNIGDFLYADLDTVFIGAPNDIFTKLEGPCVLSDFYFPGTSIGSGLMFLPEAIRAGIWEKWIVDPKGHIAHNHGDQDFLTPWLWNADRFQDKFPLAVVSYKAHLSPDDGQQFYKPGFDDMSKIGVVCFHGHPRPWHVQQRHEWIPK